MVSEDTKEGAFTVLADIKEHGTINMWESPKFLMEEMGLSKKDAKEVFLSWVKDRSSDDQKNTHG